MTGATSEGYAQFQDLLRWCDGHWNNAIQASQGWWAEHLKVSKRTIKRYWAQARLDGFLQTLRRYRRTSVQILKGGRHDAQLVLPMEGTENQQVATPCPHTVPTVVVRISPVRVVNSILCVTIEKVRNAWKGRQKPKKSRAAAAMDAVMAEIEAGTW